MSQLPLLPSPARSDPERIDLRLPDAEVWWVERFLSPAASERLMAELLAAIPWREEWIQMFGRRVRVPRRVCWLADPGVGYRYSGVDHPPTPWPAATLPLKAEVEAAAGARFNGALANLYRDGQDSMGWHADDEPALGPAPVIASLSLGATRRFQLKHRGRPDTPRVDLELPGGSLLVMSGPTQRSWKHQIPKTRRPVGPRINLTFRLLR